MKNIFFIGLVIVFSCNSPAKDNTSIAVKHAIDSLLHDSAITYYSNGKIQSIIPHTNNLRNGYSFSFDSSGNLYYKDFYYHDLAVGPIVYYHPTGEPKLYYFANLQNETLLYIDYSQWAGVKDIATKAIRFTADSARVDSTPAIALFLYLMNPPKFNFEYTLYKKEKGVDYGHISVQKFRNKLPFVRGLYRVLPENEQYVVGLEIYDSILNKKTVIYKEL